MTATRWVGARAQQALGCSVPMPTRVFSLQHSDGTFCVKPLKQKQVVSVWVSSWGGQRGAFGEQQTPVQAAACSCPAPTCPGASRV